MDAAERRAFVRDHHDAILGYNRRAHGPAMSFVYYVVAGDEILVSTMRARAKAKAVARDPKVSLCVLDGQWPPTYLQVYCDASIDKRFEHVVDVMMRIGAVMAGRPLDDSIRPLVEEGARREDRVVLRLRPYATFETPPRHVDSEEDIPNLTHQVSTSMPWDG